MRRMILGLAAAAVVGIGSARADTLFAELGGEPGVERIVTTVLTIWQADPRVARSFEDTSIKRLHKLLAEQICNISDGGCAYSGRSMAEAHKALHLATYQFNAVAEDLQTAMEQLDIPYRTQNRLLALLAPMKRDVVTR